MKTAEAYDILKEYDAFDIPNLTLLCRKEKIPAWKTTTGWDIDNSFIGSALAWRHGVKTPEEIIEDRPFYDCVPPESRWVFNEKVKDIYRREGMLVKNRYSVLFKGTFIGSQNITRAKDIADKALLRRRVNAGQLCSLKDVAAATGLSPHQIKEKIHNGQIKGFLYNSCYYIEKNECERIVEEREGVTGIYDLVKRLDIRSVFNIEDPACRFALCRYMRSTKYAPFLIDYNDAIATDRRNSILIPNAILDQVSADVTRYISNYGMSNKRIQLFEQDDYWNNHPINRAIATELGEKKTGPQKASIMHLFIDAHLPELPECGDDDFLRLQKIVHGAHTKTYAQMASAIYAYALNKYGHKFSVDLSFDLKNKKQIDVSPYALSKYFQMRHMCFNREFIADKNLIEKALGDPVLARTWMYCAMHFVCSWRAGDMNSLPVLQLFSDNQTVTGMIRSGTYSNEAIAISALLEEEINSGKIRPGKTAERQTTHYLIMHVPASIREVFGTVYSIYCIHGGGGGRSLTRSSFRQLFGDDYTRIFGDTVFSNRKANKNYLDKLVEEGEKGAGSDNKCRGNMLAILARGHSTSQTIHRYLQAKLDGYSVDEITDAMFDSGALSFVTHMLLRIVYGDRYDRLSLPVQTAVIKEFGLTPFKAEMVAASIHESYMCAAQAVNDLFYKEGSDEDRAKAVMDAMFNIANRTALSAEPSASCLYAAAGRTCPYRSQADPTITAMDCAFCPVSLANLSLYFSVLNVLDNAYQLMAAAKTKNGRRKYRNLIDQVYLPRIFALLSIMKSQGMDVSFLKIKLKEILEKDTNGGETNDRN